jgi:uncharacterized membrane protein
MRNQLQRIYPVYALKLLLVSVDPISVLARRRQLGTKLSDVASLKAAAT